MVRRTIAFGAGLLFLILVVLLFKGCLDSRKESAINDWVRDADALVNESNHESDALFAQLEGGDGASDVEVENALNGFRIQSAQLVDRASDLDHPDELDSAQQYLVETLALRAEGIAEVADNLPDALASGDQQEGAATKIAQAMQAFLASDQIYFRRVLPAIDEVLRKEGIEGKVAESTFLEDLSWLDPSEVADRLGGISSGGGTDGDAAPGTHGNALGTVTLGGLTLVPGSAVSIPLSGDLTFSVQVSNQGENTETDVQVNVTVGSGSDAIQLDGVLDTIAAGETKTVEIPLKEQPPTGQNVPVKVEIETVPGEDPAVGNNEGEFAAIFTS
jgi:hypothetical protein